MCERTCPACQSTEHFESFGMVGLYITCADCGNILAHRRDEQSARLDCPDPEAWAREGTFVTPGAEAKNPKDDVIFGRAAEEGR